jgi:hypothetical protein
MEEKTNFPIRDCMGSLNGILIFVFVYISIKSITIIIITVIWISIIILIIIIISFFKYHCSLNDEKN